MKKMMILCCALIFVLISCEQEERILESTNSVTLDKKLNFEKLANSIIGYEKNGSIELGVSEERIIATFKKFAEMHSPDINPQSFRVINIDNEYYLRFYSDGNIVSTIALLKNEDGFYQTGGTVCQSAACASGRGCVPNGQYCTECTRSNGLPGDCKRTTTEEFEPA